MRFIQILALLSLTSCQGLMPEVKGIVDDIADTAVTIQFNKEAMQDDQDIHLTLDMVNKNPPKAQ